MFFTPAQQLLLSIMALRYSTETMRVQGIGSPYASLAELYIPDPTNASRRTLDTARTTLNWSELPSAFLNIKAYQDKVGVGCSGWGIDVSLLLVLYPAVYWFLGIMLIRYLCREPFARFGIYMGVVTEKSTCHHHGIASGKHGVASLSPRNRKKIMKFQNQMWLSMFYFASSCFGYYVQRDQPWFKLPLDDEASLHLLLPHPYNPPAELIMYYHYGLAFYFAELCSLFIIERHMKRSDFLEYAVHHITTLLLILCSHIGLEHRFGAYVLFIHDASDIMLSVSKSIHYMWQEETARRERHNTKNAEEKNSKAHRKSFLQRCIVSELCLNCCFAAFVLLFFFFRLYCLPFMGKATIRMSPKVRHGNLNMWMLVFLLNVALQGLHVYWAVLIIVLSLSIAKGGELRDIRSEDEEDSECPSCIHQRSLSESSGAAAAEEGNGMQQRNVARESKVAPSLSSSLTSTRNRSQRRGSSKRKE